MHILWHLDGCQGNNLQSFSDFLWEFVKISLCAGSCTYVVMMMPLITRFGLLYHLLNKGLKPWERMTNAVYQRITLEKKCPRKNSLQWFDAGHNCNGFPLVVGRFNRHNNSPTNQNQVINIPQASPKIRIKRGNYWENVTLYCLGGPLFFPERIWYYFIWSPIWTQNGLKPKGSSLQTIFSKYWPLVWCNFNGHRRHSFTHFQVSNSVKVYWCWSMA